MARGTKRPIIDTDGIEDAKVTPIHDNASSEQDNSDYGFEDMTTPENSNLADPVIEREDNVTKMREQAQNALNGGSYKGYNQGESVQEEIPEVEIRADIDNDENQEEIEESAPNRLTGEASKSEMADKDKKKAAKLAAIGVVKAYVTATAQVATAFACVDTEKMEDRHDSELIDLDRVLRFENGSFDTGTLREYFEKQNEKCAEIFSNTEDRENALIPALTDVFMEQGIYLTATQNLLLALAMDAGGMAVAVYGLSKSNKAVLRQMERDYSRVAGLTPREKAKHKASQAREVQEEADLAKMPLAQTEDFDKKAANNSANVVNANIDKSEGVLVEM